MSVRRQWTAQKRESHAIMKYFYDTGVSSSPMARSLQERAIKVHGSEFESI